MTKFVKKLDNSSLDIEENVAVNACSTLDFEKKNHENNINKFLQTFLIGEEKKHCFLGDINLNTSENLENLKNGILYKKNKILENQIVLFDWYSSTGGKINWLVQTQFLRRDIQLPKWKNNPELYYKKGIQVVVPENLQGQIEKYNTENLEIFQHLILQRLHWGYSILIGIDLDKKFQSFFNNQEVLKSFRKLNKTSDLQNNPLLLQKLQLILPQKTVEIAYRYRKNLFYQTDLQKEFFTKTFLVNYMNNSDNHLDNNVKNPLVFNFSLTIYDVQAFNEYFFFLRTVPMKEFWGLKNTEIFFSNLEKKNFVFSQVENLLKKEELDQETTNMIQLTDDFIKKNHSEILLRAQFYLINKILESSTQLVKKKGFEWSKIPFLNGVFDFFFGANPPKDEIEYLFRKLKMLYHVSTLAHLHVALKPKSVESPCFYNENINNFCNSVLQDLEFGIVMDVESIKQLRKKKAFREALKDQEQHLLIRQTVDLGEQTVEFIGENSEEASEIVKTIQREKKSQLAKKENLEQQLSTEKKASSIENSQGNEKSLDQVPVDFLQQVIKTFKNFFSL